MQPTVQPYPQVHQGEETGELKDRFRSEIRQLRTQRSARRLAIAGEGLAHIVRTIPAVVEARTVAAYCARPGEPPTGPLLQALVRDGVQVLLPALGEGLSRSWAWYSEADELVVRAPGRPPEPPGPALGPDAIAAADVVLVPALAVDTDGTRIGQGGGWYDRALPLARPDALTVAVVFTEEVYDASSHPLPTEAHDRPVRAIATPQRWLETGRALTA
jgi:5-formyltetrahydrofolate cyclo-ligase